MTLQITGAKNAIDQCLQSVPSAKRKELHGIVWLMVEGDLLVDQQEAVTQTGCRVHEGDMSFTWKQMARAAPDARVL